jgi:hypothetical protein
MLINSKTLKGFTVHAMDGELGVVEDLYFDDETWAVRYVIVETGGWLGGRSVLISPISVSETDSAARGLHLVLTKHQVENSPNIDTHRPVSRQHEVEFMGYYGYPYYWGGPMMWGPSFAPAGLAIPSHESALDIADRMARESADSHLRSAKAVAGYGIHATDGEIGHADGFLVDDHTWAVRYIEVATRNWWPGKKVLMSPAWVRDVNWLKYEVTVGLTREQISGSPAYSETSLLTREMEEQLHAWYGREPYWKQPEPPAR